MGSINYGTQEITVDYRMTATSFNMNRWFQGIIPTGVYVGGAFELSGGEVVVKPFTAVVSDGTQQIRVKTSSNITVTGVSLANNSNVDASSPYVVLRYVHTEDENNFVDVVAVPVPSTNDVVIGKITVGSPHTWDYVSRSYPRYTQLANGAAGSQDAINASQVDGTSIKMNTSNKLEVTNWTAEHNPTTGTHKLSTFVDNSTTEVVGGKIAVKNWLVGHDRSGNNIGVETVLPWNNSFASGTTGWATAGLSVSFRYKKIGTLVYVIFNIIGTGNTLTTSSFTLPYAPYNDQVSLCRTLSGTTYSMGYIALTGTVDIANAFYTTTNTAWTASVARNIQGQFFYQTAS